MHATAQPDAPARRRRALLVATASYADPGLAALRAPTGDVDALAEVLADGSIGEFEVSRLVDRPTEELKKEIEGFFGEARRDDLLLLYFSCHGVLSQSRRFYFATATTALKWLRATAVEDSFVNDVMQHSRARSIVLVLDCCHSGAFGKGLQPKSAMTVDVEHRFEGRGRVTLSASTALEYAFEEADPATGINELEPAAPGSLFTRFLVQGLATGNADIDGDGDISVDELYDYVCQRMRERAAHQTPGMAGDVRGEIVIARSRRAALPAELQQAVDSRLAGVREGAVTELAVLLRSADPRVAEPARAALERLAGDDSQRVSARARAALEPAARDEPPTAVLTPPQPAAPPPRPAAPVSAGPPEQAAAPPRPAPAPAGPPQRATQRVRPFGRPRRGAVLAAAAALLVAAAAGAWSLIGGDSGPPLAYDFDGDGAQEIVMAPVAADSAAVVIHPGPDGDDFTTIPAADAGVPDAEGGFGAGLTSADFDGDGNADLAIGVPSLELVAILYGAGDGTYSERRQRIQAADFELPSTTGRYGANVLARDLNGDGFGDLVVSAPGDPKAWGEGAVQIIFGGEEGLQTGSARLLEYPPESSVGAFGSRLRSGDVNHDGHVDLVEGSPDPASGDTAGHIAYCPGAADGPTACHALPQVDGDNASSALAVADVNGDGFDDIVQADAELPEGPGGLRLWRGGARGPSREPTVVTADQLALPELTTPESEFGHSVDAGLLDDDRYADVVVGAPGYGAQSGAVAVIRGGPGGFAPTGHRLVRSDLSAEGDRLGSNLAMLRLAGDDEPPEIAVTAERAGFDTAVQVLRGEELVRLPGLGRAAQGSADSLRLGRTPGP